MPGHYHAGKSTLQANDFIWASDILLLTIVPTGINLVMCHGHWQW